MDVARQKNLRATSKNLIEAQMWLSIKFHAFSVTLTVPGGTMISYGFYGERVVMCRW